MKLANLHATSRLQEVYILWHKSVEAYEKPDEFRTNLNACVQAIRNVTFILQSQKSEIEDFEKWYSPWQNAMKNDKIMRWCVEARNIIVKAGDIEKNSMAIVSYVASYFEPPKWHLIVDPFPSATEIAHYVTIKYLPTELRNNGFLKIEKRWVSDDFPNVELLEVLAYAFSFLVRLLSDIEKREGPNLRNINENLEKEFKKSTEILKIIKNDLPTSMVAFEDVRTQWLKLPNFEVVKTVIRDLNFDVPREKVIKRYGDLSSLSSSEKEIKSDLKKLATLFLKQAKQMLKKDKCLACVAFLISEDKKVTINKIEYVNYDDKYFIWEAFAKEVLRQRAESIIIIGEAWGALDNLNNLKMRVENSPDRFELISVTGLSKDGEAFEIVVPFYRRWGKIHFKEQFTNEGCIPNYLLPVRKVWGLNLS